MDRLFCIFLVEAILLFLILFEGLFVVEVVCDLDGFVAFILVCFGEVIGIFVLVLIFGLFIGERVFIFLVIGIFFGIFVVVLVIVEFLFMDCLGIGK